MSTHNSIPHRRPTANFGRPRRYDLDRDAVGAPGDPRVTRSAALLIEHARGRSDDAPVECVGLVDLRPMPGSDFFPQGAVGGFTLVVALVRDEHAFRQSVTLFFAGPGVEIRGFNDVQTVAGLLAQESVSDELIELAGVLSDEEPVLHDSEISLYESEDDWGLS